MKRYPGFDLFKVMLIIARKLNHNEYSHGFERAVYTFIHFVALQTIKQ